MAPDENRKKRVAILGGSFNPPHVGHAALGCAAAADCDELWVMPSGDRADKTPGLHEERRALAEAFAADLAERLGKPVRVETVELEMEPPIWTYRTLGELGRRYPGHDFGFVVTSELLAGMRATWEDGEALWREGDFIVADRPGHPTASELPPRATPVRVVAPEVSSTQIRAALAAGEDVAHLLTPRVGGEIRARSLYASRGSIGA